MALIDIYNVGANRTDLYKRIVAACVGSAGYILNEASSVPNHDRRVSWAKRTLLAPETEVRRLLWFVAQDPTISAHGEASTDSELMYAVAALIDTVGIGEF